MRRFYFILLPILVLSVSACSPGATPRPALTATPTFPPAPTQSPALALTSTPKSTSTPTITNTRTPTRTPTISPTPLPSQTSTPSPTQTPPPSITPTFTATPDISALISASAPLAHGKGISSAAKYDPSQAGPYPVVIISAAGTAYTSWPDDVDWNEKLPYGWRPASIRQAELVLVISKEREIDLGSQAYDKGPDITRYRYETDVTLRAARTGQKLAAYTFVGSDPEPFPQTAPIDQTRLEGTHLVYPSLETWLCPTVAKQGCWGLLRILEGQANGIISLAFSPDGQTLAAGTGYLTTFQVSQVSDGALLSSKQLDTQDNFLSIAFSPDGQTLAASTYNKTVLLYHYPDGALLNTLALEDASAVSLAFSPDGQTLASGSSAGIVSLWRVSDDTLLRTLEGHKYGVTSLAFSPDGQTLASGSEDGTVRQWRVSDGSLLGMLQEPDAPLPLNTTISCVAFSPDGQTLATGSHDYTVRLWRVSDGSLLHTMTGAEMVAGGEAYFGITSLVFSPDGQTLAAGDANASVHLWQVSDGSLMHTLEGNLDDNMLDPTDATYMVFSPDGQILAISSGHGRIRLWQYR